jgi:hypothetical protein
MNDLKVRHWTGAFGVAGFVVFLVALPLYFLGTQPAARLEDTVQFSDSLSRASTLILTRTTLADPLIMACLLVFLAGFRHLIQQARPDYEWVSTLVFGAGLVVITLELAGDAQASGEPLTRPPRPIPPWSEASGRAASSSMVQLDSSCRLLLFASAGYAILATGVLPRWTGWMAYACAVVNLVAAPSIFGGTDYTGFYTASGYVTFIGQGAMLIWFLIASVSMLVVKREAKAMTLREGRLEKAL